MMNTLFISTKSSLKQPYSNGQSGSLIYIGRVISWRKLLGFRKLACIATLLFVIFYGQLLVNLFTLLLGILSGLRTTWMN